MGKKVVLVILDHFADWEGAYLASGLMGGEISKDNVVLWASTDKNPKKSIGHMTVLPDLALDEIPEDADALILIGGNSWRTEEAKKVAASVEKFLAKHKVVGFICDATHFAAEQGFLNDVRHTGNDPEDLKATKGYNNSENYVMENAIADQGIITANGNSPAEFAALVLEELEAADPDDIRMWSDFHTMGYLNALKKYGYL